MAPGPRSAAPRRQKLAVAGAVLGLALAAVAGPACAAVADDSAAAMALAVAITSVWDRSEAAPADVSAVPFVVRRIANPHWRPPAPPVALQAAHPNRHPRALDHLAAQVLHFQVPGADPASHWQIVAGEQTGHGGEVEVFAAASRTFRNTDLEGLRLSARRGVVSGGLGDQAPITFDRMAQLQRLRGATIRVGSNASGWTLLGGVPTPVPGQRSAPLMLAGLALDGARFDVATFSLAALAFDHRRSGDPSAPDSAGGRGGFGSLGWRVPLAGGALAASLGGQLDDLDGARALALMEGVTWDFTSRRVAATIGSERSSSGARILGTDRIAPAPGSQDRWSLQARSASGHQEAHFAGVVRRGGEEALQARTISGGVSGSIGRSAWYGGMDAAWDTRPTLDERRWSVQAGRGWNRGATLLSRIELVERPHGPAALGALAETSFPFGGGARLELEPRIGVAEGQLQNGQLTGRWSSLLGGSGVRFTGTLALGGSRGRELRGVVREAAVALSFQPRPRERGDLEVRRLDEDGPPAMEYSARYDATLERYDAPPGWAALRDTGSVTVIVGRSGNGSGMPDVLVSLDGQALRFTDADGIARFDHVAPGVHTVAIEERSLAENLVVSGTSRVFVTVESGRVPEPVRFTVGRRERRTRF